jgi:hypothetical protein
MCQLSDIHSSNFRHRTRFTQCRNTDANMDLAYVLMS